MLYTESVIQCNLNLYNTKIYTLRVIKDFWKTNYELSEVVAAWNTIDIIVKIFILTAGNNVSEIQPPNKNNGRPQNARLYPFRYLNVPIFRIAYRSCYTRHRNWKNRGRYTIAEPEQYGPVLRVCAMETPNARPRFSEHASSDISLSRRPR